MVLPMSPIPHLESTPLGRAAERDRMNENVGASFGLSVLIVVFFAVALYQPDRPPPSASLAPLAPVEPLEARAMEPPPAPPVKPAPRPAAAKAPPAPEARGSFTVVRDGESLADVARRVYGDDRGGRESLWRANRDLVDRLDSPVPAGSVLRTP
jgi:nucleoid-associated protein YgaU